MRLRKDQLTLSIVFMVLGILLATMFSISQQSKKPVQSSRKQELITIIRDLEAKREALKAELHTLRNQLNQNEKQAAATEGTLASFTKEQEQLSLAAGLMPMKGKGLTISLGDSPSVPFNQNPNDYIIHDSDIRVVINSLWASGAEAIAVNNQRIVASTPIRCAGNTVLINSTRCASPYIIYAIGDPVLMGDGLDKDPDVSRLFKHYSQSYGLKVNIQKDAEVVVPAYKGSLRVEFAKVYDKGEGD